MHFKHGFEPVDVLETTKLIQSLTSCLAHISDIPFSPSHMEAISNCVPHAIAAADMKFKAVTPSGAPNTYALDETKNALLLSLIELVHAPAIDKWSSDALRKFAQLKHPQLSHHSLVKGAATNALRFIGGRVN